MKKMTGIFPFSLMAVLLFPMQVFAVDFTIEKTMIDAYLQENGNVHVIETHTYEFDSEFNGITRTLIEKSGTAISDFSANESGKPLEVELDGQTYRIYRAGENETVTIELSYMIENGVDVYEDMADFYWPFFDSNNESDYENMTIAVHPPKATNDVIAFGYDEAFDTEKIQRDGTAVFELGFVSSGKNGNIRAAYDSSLFPVAVKKEGTIREALVQEQEKLIKRAEEFREEQAIFKKIAPIVAGIYVVILLALLLYAQRKKRQTMLEVERLYHSQSMYSIVPKLIMSMPATIYYYRNSAMNYGEMLTVGLMDLVRKGNVVAKDEETYYLKNPKAEHDHESQLIHLLFRKVGENNTFSFKQLKGYIQKESYQKSLMEALAMYRAALNKEIKSHQLVKPHIKTKVFATAAGLLLIPFLFMLGIYELYMWLVICFMLMLVYMVFSVFFKTYTVKGLLIKYQWDQFKKSYKEIKESSWYGLSKDDKERAFLFSTGLNDIELKKKNKFIVENYGDMDDTSNANLMMMLMMSGVGLTSFSSATETSAQSFDSSTSTFTGTGVGGGGGGSGAF